MRPLSQICGPSRTRRSDARRVHGVYPDVPRAWGDPPLAMKKLMAYKYRLRPTAEQRVLLGKIAGHNRFVWNKALENHRDYRMSEIVPVIEGVDSPWLRINCDFSNSLNVVEDYVEADHLAAPYTAMTHLRDMRVQSITTTGEPDPNSIPNCMEPPCLPDYDPQLWMRLSIEWLESNCAEFFPRRFDTTCVG